VESSALVCAQVTDDTRSEANVELAMYVTSVAEAAVDADALLTHTHTHTRAHTPHTRTHTHVQFEKDD